MEDVNNEILSTEMRKSRRIKMDKKFLEDCLNKGMSTRDIEKICNKHANPKSNFHFNLPLPLTSINNILITVKMNTTNIFDNTLTVTSSTTIFVYNIHIKILKSTIF